MAEFVVTDNQRVFPVAQSPRLEGREPPSVRIVGESFPEPEEEEIESEEPEVEETRSKGDGLSDLFEVTNEDVMGGDNENIADLTRVSQEDVMGGTQEDISDLTDVPEEDITGGDIGDVVNVSHADIMGDNIDSPLPSKPRTSTRGRRVIRRISPPTSLGGMR